MSWLVDAVPPSERAQVESALMACPVLSLPVGTALGPERFEAIRLLAVEAGLVAFSAGVPQAARRIIVSLAGHGSLLIAPAAHERLEAVSDARVTLITSGAHERLLNVPAAAAVVFDEVGSAVRECRESLAQLSHRRQTDRVRSKLMQLAGTFGKVGPEGLFLDLPLTHELLADMVGATRETVTRSLARLAASGLVTHERGRYVLVRPSGAASARASSMVHGASGSRQRGVSH